MNTYVCAVSCDEDVEIKSVVANSYHDAERKIIEAVGYSDDDAEGFMNWDEFIELESKVGNFYSPVYDIEELKFFI